MSLGIGLILSTFCIHLQATPLSKTAQKIEWLVDLYPNTDFKSTAQDYIRIIAPELYESSMGFGQENVGLQELVIEKFESDENLRNSALSFYNDVALYWTDRLRGPTDDLPMGDPYKCGDDGQGPGPFAIPYQCEKDLPRIQLNETTEKGINRKFQTGWLWSMALKHADGDPNLAVDLIGLCGHDNRFQGIKKYIDAGSGETKYLNCPAGNSPFYVPGSLPQADISEDLKKEIDKIQNPQGTKNIPAKYYHVLGEAFVSCQLVAKGHKSKNIVAVAKLAAHAYRGLYLCETTAPFLRLYKQISEWSWGALLRKTSLEKLMENKISLCVSHNTSSECQELSRHVDYFAWPSLSSQDRHSYLRRIIAQADASHLYSRWFLPCTGLQFRGQKNLSAPDGTIFKARPRGWSQARYNDAKQVLSTWMVDMKWTVAQHEAGAKFATRVCKPKR